MKTEDGNLFLDANDASKLGLIFKINNEILHPLGLALTRDSEGNFIGMMVAEDNIWEYPESTKEKFSTEVTQNDIIELVRSYNDN